MHAGDGAEEEAAGPENDGDITLMDARLGKVLFVTDTEENILYIVNDQF